MDEIEESLKSTPRKFEIPNIPLDITALISLKSLKTWERGPNDLWYKMGGYEFGAPGMSFGELLLWHGPLLEFLEEQEKSEKSDQENFLQNELQ